MLEAQQLTLIFIIFYNILHFVYFPVTLFQKYSILSTSLSILSSQIQSTHTRVVCGHQTSHLSKDVSHSWELTLSVSAYWQACDSTLKDKIPYIGTQFFQCLSWQLVFNASSCPPWETLSTFFILFENRKRCNSWLTGDIENGGSVEDEVICELFLM